MDAPVCLISECFPWDFRNPGMLDNINKVMITNATRNNTTVSNIILFVGDNVVSQGINFSYSLVASFITCVRPYVLYM